jgi:hypothetical protein
VRRVARSDSCGCAAIKTATRTIEPRSRSRADWSRADRDSSRGLSGSPLSWRPPSHKPSCRR